MYNTAQCTKSRHQKHSDCTHSKRQSGQQCSGNTTVESPRWELPDWL